MVLLRSDVATTSSNESTEEIHYVNFFFFHCFIIFSPKEKEQNKKVKIYFRLFFHLNLRCHCHFEALNKNEDEINKEKSCGLVWVF